MAKKEFTPPNFTERKVLDKLQDVLDEKLEQLPEINEDSRGYTVNGEGAVIGLALPLSEIDDAILKMVSSLTNLTELHLDNNRLTDVSVLASLTHLKKLFLHANKLTDISILGSLAGLTELALSDNPLTDLSAITSLKNLTSLYLAGNSLIDMSSLTSLKSLTYLCLRHNQLTDVSVLASLTNLTGLDLGNNKLTDVLALASLTSLTELDLDKNKLTDVSALASLTSLTELDLDKNKLTDVSALAFLTSLTELDLDNNKLTDVSVLASLANLTGLDLGNNKLTDVSALASLINLAELDLRNNKLTDVSALASLINLTELDLRGNKLTDVSALASLTNLTELDLRKNQLKDIPRQFFNRGWPPIYKDIYHYSGGLNLFGNPLESPPVEIVKKGREAVLRYFASLEGERKRLNEVKVLLVGTGGSGKTSLIKRIFGEAFDGKESQTKGIVIRDKRYGKGNKAVKAHFWDFGGQVIMHSSHQFFLSQRSLYILVLDGRKEEDAEYWLGLIQSFGGDSPILVVLNKMDENPGFEVNRRFLKDKYKRILGFYRVSCKNKMGNGITGKGGLIEAIREAFSRVETIGSEWGRSWFQVKKQLEQMKAKDEHFIDSTEYQRICEQAGITDAEDQETLVAYLNDLGVILHFGDIDLADMHVLEPHWVTDAVYRIINSNKLADNHGELRADDLKKILKKRKTEDFSYPAGKHPYILKLMEKFELCYPMGTDGRVLVPDLQDVQQPELPSLGENPLRFYFEYSFLPSSILPRITVRMHDEIVGELRWRTGLVVRNKDFDATAVIKSDPERKRIYIEIYGDHKQGYFSCIRREFFRIHDSFNKLGVTQWILLPGNDGHAVTYSSLYGHWKAGKAEYFHGETGTSYSVNNLLNGIETEEERFANLLENIGVRASDLKGKIGQDINIYIQNLIGQNTEAWQVNSMRDYHEKNDNKVIEKAIRILTQREKGASDGTVSAAYP